MFGVLRKFGLGAERAVPAITTLSAKGDGPAPMTVRDLLGEFSSLGDNCEFGIVQRYADLEPLNFFRFAFTPRPHLREALKADLEHLGTAEDLELITTEIGEYMCRSRAYGAFDYHTEVLVGDEPAETVRLREIKKVAYMRRRMLSDLEDAERIFVRKNSSGATEEEMGELASALRKRGPNIMLWVAVADEANPAGKVEIVEPGLLKGYISRFADHDAAFLMDFQGWVQVCSEALRQTRLMQGRPSPAPLEANVAVSEGFAWTTKASAEMVTAASAAGRSRHRLLALRSETDRGASEVATCEPGVAVRKDRRLIFSVWVRIPEAFSGAHLSVEFQNKRKNNFRMSADLSKRDQWQRLWASSMMHDGADGGIGLEIAGARGSQVLLSGWRFEEGYQPGDEAAPEVTRGFR